MNIDERKKTVEILETLRVTAYKSYSDRRDYEWKMCIAVWTLQAAFVFAMVTTKDVLPIPGTHLFWGTSIAMVATCCVHFVWTINISKRNGRDSLLSLFYNEQIQRVAEVTLPTPLASKVKDMKKELEKVWRWSYIVEFAITVILAVVAIATAVERLLVTANLSSLGYL